MTTAAAHEFERRYQVAITKARAFSDALAGPSMADQLAALCNPELLAELAPTELTRLLYDWSFWGRPKQDPDLSEFAHRILFLLGGRGAGKTISGSQRIRRRVEAGARSIAIVGPTFRDIERYQITGEGGGDGIVSVFPPAKAPEWKPHKSMVFFHRNECPGCSSAEKCGGAIAYVNSAEEPEFRGPNLDTVWCDEPAKWRYLETIWHNIELATRLAGKIELEIIMTGTPLPLKLLREIIADQDTVTILMAQEENASNLDTRYVDRMRRKYGGTRIGRQELDGEILSDNPDALFHASVLDAHRVESIPVLVKKAIAVDPAISTKPDNDDTGLIGGGLGADGHIYVFLDATTEKAKPEKWGSDVCKACKQHEIDTVVGERNRGGDLVAANVRAMKERESGVLAAQALKIVEVHASRGKETRAEPVATLCEKGFVHIVGTLPKLEGELTEWNPRIGGVSPNRLDAFVWLVWYLAELDKEEEADHSSGFIGLTEAAAQLQGRGGASLAALLPRSDRGSTL